MVPSLHNSSFQDQDRSFVDARGMDLTGTVFSGSNISGANFDGANLQDARFSDHRVRVSEIAPHISNSEGPDAEPAPHQLDCKYCGSLPKGATSIRASYIGANLTGTEGIGAVMIASNFSSAAMQSSIWTCANLIGTVFNSANAENAHFCCADLRGASFVGANLRGACFRGAILVSVDFSGADLRGATFDQSVLQSKLYDPNCQHEFTCQLHGAQISGSNLELFAKRFDIDALEAITKAVDCSRELKAKVERMMRGKSAFGM